MIHLEYLSNYQNDLLCSQKTPLLIELTKEEIKQLHNNSQNQDASYFPLLIAQDIYNSKPSDKGTNIIVIDGDNITSPNSFVLVEILLDKLRDELKSIKNLTTLKESLKAAASMASGGLINDFVGDYLDKGLSFIFDEVSEEFSSLLTETAINQLDISNVMLSSVEELLSDSAGNKIGDIVNKINQQKLCLSSSAKSELDVLSNTFSKSKNIDAFQLTFKLLLAVAIDSPKLLYINNPHKLDSNSIGLLSLLFSFAKNKKDQDKHIGLSVVYTYTDEAFHLYNDVSKTLQGKQQLLVAQRRFTQRYSMLEKPGSDIPVVAVKSSLFIGRNQELEQLTTQYINRQPTTFSVISGEPGIGKTALVNQHLTHIQEQGEVITLTLLNEVGHSSNNTGLSSLEKSILDEAKRIELLIGWKDKGFNFVKNIGSKDNAFKAIGMIFSGIDKPLAIADAGFQRLSVDKNIERVQQSAMGDLDNKQGDEKQQQFDKLDKALKKLSAISSNKLPIVLFIDDLQWIDDTASEYILTRLLKQPDLYLVTTLRPSDGATILKEQLTRPSLHTYSLALLKACEVKGFEECDESTQGRLLQTRIIKLPGFDKQVLAELISKVIKGKSEQCDALANSIFTALAGKGADDVNTLFAVETINMLCDKKLYGENTFERLILDTPLRFNPELKNVESTLTKTFATLQAKYKDSLAHANESGSGQRFNLMAYAVLEERLHLLKLYFGKQGNAAVNTLLFSSLLGAPFSSELVKKVMLAVTERDIPELLPLKSYLIGSETEAYLLPEHYSIIDEVYEILRRLSVGEDRYQYRHGLLHTFLDKQFDYLLDTVFISNTVEAKDQLLQLITWEIHDSARMTRYDLRIEPEATLKLQELRFTYDALLNVLAKAFLLNPSEDWAETYIGHLTRIQQHFTEYNKTEEAIQLAEQVRALCIYIPLDERDEYVVDNLTELISLYNKTNRIDEVIVLYGEMFKVDASDKYSSLDLNEQLSGLANAYLKVNRSEETVVQFEKILAAQDPASAINIDVLRRIASCYAQVNRSDEAIVLAEEVVMRFGDVTDLVLLSYCYAQNNQISDAILVAQKSLKDCNKLYQSAPEKYVQKYLESLAGLAFCYQRNNQRNEVIRLEEEALPIIEGYYAKAPDVWVSFYTTSLNNLAKAYNKLNQIERALAYAEKAVALDEHYYVKVSVLWAKHYTSSLLNLASVYKRKKRITEALPLAEKALLICQKYHSLAPAYWAELYFDCLTVLADTYRCGNLEDSAAVIDKKIVTLCESKFLIFPENTEGASIANDNNSTNFASYFKATKTVSDDIPFRERIVFLYEGLYESSMDKEWDQSEWDDIYCRELEKLAHCYKENQQLGEAIKLEEKSLLIYSPERIKRLRPKRGGREKVVSFIEYYAEYFAEDYFKAISRLANSYAQNKQVEEAIKLQVTLLDLSGECYAQNAGDWAQRYTAAMNSLIHCYYKNKQFSNVLKLKQKVMDLYLPLCDVAADLWFTDYLTCLYNLAAAYYKNNQLSVAIRMLQHGLSISEMQYIKRPFINRENHLVLLNTLEDYYEESLESIEPLLFSKKISAVNEDSYAHPPNLSNYEEATSLMAKVESMNMADATELGERVISLLYDYYSVSPTAWAYDYTECLIKVASFYHQTGLFSQAIKHQITAVAICESYYDGNVTIWAENYTTSLTNLARYYQVNGQEKDAITLEKKALIIIESLSHKKTTSWFEKYSENLTRLIDYYKTNNQMAEALALEKKALVINESLYHQDSGKWAERYARGALNLAYLYKKHNLLQDAFMVEEELLVVLEHYYKPSEDRATYRSNPREKSRIRDSKEEKNVALFWAVSLKKVLSSLAIFSAQKNQLDTAINFEKKAISLCISYKNHSEFKAEVEWDKWSKETLDDLITYYQQNNQMHEAIKVELEHSSIYYNSFSRDPIACAEQYIARLHYLDDYCEADLSLYWQQFSVIQNMSEAYKILYSHSPKAWKEGYLYALNAKASFYLGERDYYGGHSNFKEYFKIFSVETLNEVKQCIDFINPFIQYAHASIYLSAEESDHIDENENDYFDKIANFFNIEMSNKFADVYEEYILLLLNGSETIEGYKRLSLSNDPAEYEKYHLFYHYFCKS